MLFGYSLSFVVTNVNKTHHGSGHYSGVSWYLDNLTVTKMIAISVTLTI